MSTISHRDMSVDKILDCAKSWLGTPYVHQMSKKNAGTDCLGLVRGVYRELYGSEPELPPAYTPDWTAREGDGLLLNAAFRHLVPKNSNDVGAADIILFRIMHDGPVKHMGIALSTDKFLHAYAGREVCESWLSRWWAARIVNVFQFPGVSL